MSDWNGHVGKGVPSEKIEPQTDRRKPRLYQP
ncbi:hypothetical protein EV184_111223 [Sinorhizobium americanum]|uniref:Uncharacterized protein n=1 Tax=Sinorhizobium americanum TaxID=194963 RepID=A0A4R2BNT2_9HYPH|nr:hypothetical protein EV184_111223 [Sinorhizobium americanum]